VTTQARATIASATPGRVRVRLQRTEKSRDIVESVKEHVVGRPGVTQVSTSAVTGSVVVHYDRESASHDDIIGMFRDAGVIVESIAGLEGAEELSAPTPASQRVIEAVDRLDRRLARLTGYRVDLRLLFPAGLFAIGLRQALVEGLGLTDVPGYVLLWYAFDSFWKLHRELPARGGSNANRPAADTTVTATLDATTESASPRSRGGDGGTT